MSNVFYRFENNDKTIIISGENQYDIGIEDAAQELIQALNNFTQYADSCMILAFDNNTFEEDCDEQVDDCVGLTD